MSTKYLYTVGVLGPEKNGKRWFEVISRHTILSEALHARDRNQNNVRDARYSTEVKDGHLESGYV